MTRCRIHAANGQEFDLVLPVVARGVIVEIDDDLTLRIREVRVQGSSDLVHVEATVARGDYRTKLRTTLRRFEEAIRTEEMCGSYGPHEMREAPKRLARRRAALEYMLGLQSRPRLRKAQ